MLGKLPKIAILLLVLTSFAFSGTIIHRYSFNSPSVIISPERTYIYQEDCFLLGAPGEPPLPAYGVKLLLPPGEAIVAVNVSTSFPIVTASGVQLTPGQEPVPISFPGPFSPTPPNPAIYQSDDLFPSDLIANEQTQYYCGYSLGYFALFPVQYRPLSGEISYYPEITVTVTTAQTPQSFSAWTQNYRAKAEDRMRLSHKVDNPEYAETYGALVSNTDNPQIPYLIITNNAFADAFTPLIEFKNNCGYSTEVVTVSDINSNYPGADIQEKIRNCIIVYYYSYNTNYVLLAGDDEFIPHRGMWAVVGQTLDDDIPADLYYGGLDGDWDNDNDGNFGETGEGDLVAEVMVGRAAVDSYTEAFNFVHKQMMYQTQPVADEIEKALMVGEDLEWNIWGSDLKEEVRWGTYNSAGFPPNFQIQTLYDTPAWHFSGMGDLLPLLNQGFPIVNHMGHADVEYMMKFVSTQVNDNNMTNNGINRNYYIIYSQGCYCGAFDNRTVNGAYTNDCISEKFSVIANGAVCMVTNSRYGWGDTNSTNGPSQYYDRQFFDALFGENISKIGEVNQDSKEDNIPFLGAATLWCYYELNLLGDPTLDIWTAEPSNLNPNYPAVILLGAQSYTVEIPGVEGAYCALSNEEGLISSAYTNSNGIATIAFSTPITAVENLILGITAHNYYPFTQDILVLPPNAPFVVIEQSVVNDTLLGDGDGILDLGENSYIGASFQNVGSIPAQGLMAEIFCQDENITLVNSSINIGDLPASGNIVIDDAFQISVGNQVTDHYLFTATIQVRDDDNSLWTQDFDFEVSAPDAIISEAWIFDDNNNHLLPGENADIQVTLSNTGSGEIRQGQAVLSTDNPNIIIDAGLASAPFIASAGNSSLSPMFEISVGGNCPLNSNIPLYIEFEDSMGYHHSLLFEILVGNYFDDFENGVGDWTHSSCSPTGIDEWNISSFRNYTALGANSWHCGNSVGGTYSPANDAGLVTPWLEMARDAILTFRHWMQAETSATAGYGVDAGWVEISYNNVVFIPITPIGGYPYYLNAGQPTNFGFSGNYDWQEANFNLALFPLGDFKLRFRFYSDNRNNFEGWYIDDIELVYYSQSNPPSNFQALLEGVMARLSWNSPLPPQQILGKSGGSQTETLLHYAIFRNDAVLVPNFQGLNYDDDLGGLPAGQYGYKVCAVYSDCDSAFTPTQYVDYTAVNSNPLSTGTPECYFLQSNYPNPFNPETSFKFGLPVESQVVFTIYNTAGQEVYRWKNEQCPAGEFILNWRADNLPSGIYFYNLQANDFNAIGKMALVK